MKRCLALLAGALFALGALAIPHSAQAEEAIEDFASDITIAANGDVGVRETIIVNAEGDAIRHGIFRDFPTIYTDKTGKRVRVAFDVQSVARDGHPEPYDLQTIANGKRVRIGDANSVIEPGAHTYVIAYRTDRQIGFFPDYDELYWNVTGNGWAFPIEMAEADIHLPPGARALQTSYYTGAQGASGKDAREEARDGGVHFATTMPLGPHQGFTVAVGFSKGAVTTPGPATRAQDFLRDNASPAAALLGLAVLSVFYGVTWWRFGRDPAPGPVVPLFAAPAGLSAASVRFIHRMGYDRKAFAAALIAMAVKSYLTIAEEDGTYTLTRTGKSEGAAGLSQPEIAVARALFASGNAIELKNANHETVSRAISELKTALVREDEGVYFVTNRGWFFAGLAILVASGLAAALFAEEAGPAGFMLVWLGGWTAATAFLLIRAFNAWRTAASGPGSRVLNFMGALFSTLFAAPFLLALLAGFYFLGGALPLLTVVPLLLQGALAGAFYHLLKAPTLAGAKIRDAIDGFRMFLVTAEKDRLEVLNPPQVTPAVFEKFLPYAIALDAENAWSRKFEAEAAHAGLVPQTQTYAPLWYSGPSFGRYGMGGFAGALGASVAGATAAAAAAPGGSSGSGGGGFSGGGGGGGGGGGW